MNTLQNTYQKQKLDAKKMRRKHVLKALIFSAILFVAMTGMAWLKFYLSPNSNIPIGSGVYLLLAAAIAFIVGAQFIYLLSSRIELFRQRDLYFGGTVIFVSFSAIIFFEMVSVFAIPTTLVAFISAPLFKSKRDAFTANIFCNAAALSVFMIEFVYALPGAPAADPFRVFDLVANVNLGLIGGALAAYLVSTKPGRLQYILKGLVVGFLMYIAVLIYAATLGVYRERVPLGYVAVAGLILAFGPFLISLLLQPILEYAFNLLTDARLVDLTDHNSPLLKRMQLETPGTFAHSLAVASLAEMCAFAIGENPYLARACAYYHDMGKLENPEYYKENQGEKNLHDELLPEISADIIKAHTLDGLALCDKHRIPREISHVTVQHHGTQLIPIFYDKAKSMTDGEVDTLAYSYQGVTPRSKVAAIIMICDASEAAIRSLGAPDAVKVYEIVTKIVTERIMAKQFDKCEISLKDLNTIRDTIVNAHGGLYHTRLSYA